MQCCRNLILVATHPSKEEAMARRSSLPFRVVAMEEGGWARALWLVLVASAIVSAASSGVEAAAANDGQPATATPTAPDTNVLCVSKCGTCPTVCTSPPPPSPSDAGDSTAPPKSGGGGGYPSPPSPQGQQAKGGRPSNYYYFFTAAGSRSVSCGGASAYALVFLVLVAVVANSQ